MPFSDTTQLKSVCTTYACSMTRKVNDSVKARPHLNPSLLGTTGVLVASSETSLLSVVPSELSASIAVRSREPNLNAKSWSGGGSTCATEVQSSRALLLESQRDDGS